jgi:hypothetical protein
MWISKKQHYDQVKDAASFFRVNVCLFYSGDSKKFPKNRWCPFPTLPNFTSQKLAVIGYRDSLHRWLTRGHSGGTTTSTAGLTRS